MGAREIAAGLLLEIRVLPMLALLLCGVLGIAWAQGSLAGVPPDTPTFLAALFASLFTAHLTDSWIDVTKRGDRTPSDFPLLFRDSTGLIPDAAYPVLVLAGTTAFLLLTAPLVITHGPVAGALVAFGLVLSLLYSPALDRNLLGVSLAYPAGAAAAVIGGYFLASGRIDLKVASLALPIFVVLVGTKIRSDIIDVADDRRIGKRTVPVVFGERAALRAGYGFALGGLAAVAALPLALGGASSLLAVPPVGVAIVMLGTARSDPFRGSMAMAGALFMLLLAEVVILGFAIAT